MNNKVYNFLYIIKHKIKVLFTGIKVCVKVLYRCLRHDNSKFNKNEFNINSTYIKEMSQSLFLVSEYEKYYQLMLDGFKFHYRNPKNSHHIEHYNNDFSKINIFDFIEMIIDWKVTIEQNGIDNLSDCVKKLEEKYDIPYEIISIINNSKEMI